MEPVTLLFAAYLELARTDPGIEIDNDADMGALHSEMISYHGLEIPFDYQQWRILGGSVCKSYQQRSISLYSSCTVEAKSLFNDLCQEMRRSPAEGNRYTKLKEMYCTAATLFQPSIATISSTNYVGPFESAKKRCNQMTIEAMIDKSIEKKQRRDIACQRYHEMK
ncbi:hypothetical protein BOW53_13545 [Solemya pervernicosa gill symbiont]|uniref:Uncharacterized protein n=1 Tax=Solemya pervernicosa gill symbiont TaxID=642797 RepID=A0A1T2L1F6_9GAMM|nr:hypothetical protein [Solemya pervernicosa gill symbiont]OOZ38927.1 hypothetical protein BOW53_13545 [Solemya pervernicosa gill symbiont]